MFAQSLQGPRATTRNHDLTSPDTEVARTTEVDLERALEIFLAERTRLFRIAHRVVGDVSSAEEVVQEAWLRWQRANHAQIRNSAAFLSTMTAHLAINVIQSAHRRHETPTESALADFIRVTQDPAGDIERIADVEQTLDLLVAKLMPAELTAYLLRKAFDYPYRDIAHLLRTSVPNVRQLVRRAQPRIEGPPARTVVNDVHHRLVTAFIASTRTGDLEVLERVLADYARSASTCTAPAAHAERRGREGQGGVRGPAAVALERPGGGDGCALLEVAAVLTPGRRWRSGDPAGSPAAVRRPHGRDDRRGPDQLGGNLPLQRGVEPHHDRRPSRAGWRRDVSGQSSASTEGE